MKKYSAITHNKEEEEEEQTALSATVKQAIPTKVADERDSLLRGNNRQQQQQSTSVSINLGLGQQSDILVTGSAKNPTRRIRSSRGSCSACEKGVAICCGPELSGNVQLSHNCCSCCCCSYCNCNCNYIQSKISSSLSNNLLEMSRATKLLSSYFIAELIGTFLLVVIGDGAIAAYVLTKRDIDMFTACFGFGVGAMIATFAAAKISGAHINPAATLAFALDGRLNWRLVPVYMVAQYLGGFLAALTLIINYSEAIYSIDAGQHSAFGSTNSTGNIFATYPGAWVSPWGSLLDQIIGTAILLFSLCAVTDKNNANLEDRHQPIYIAFVIGMICVSFNPNCGAIFNPARDLAPRLLTFVFGYTTAFKPTQGLYWLLAGVVGPHIGAIMGLFAYKFLIGSSLARKEEYEFEMGGGGGGGQVECSLDHHHNQKRPHHHHHHHQASQSQNEPMQTSKFGSHQPTIMSMT